MLDSGAIAVVRMADAGRLRSLGFEAVAVTLRESLSVSVNGWSAMLHNERDCAER